VAAPAEGAATAAGRTAAITDSRVTIVRPRI
jgi:hypothetical protein